MLLVFLCNDISYRESQTNTKLIGDGSCKEADESKACVKNTIRCIGESDIRSHQATSTETTKSVEHAGTTEADQTQEADLHHR